MCITRCPYPQLNDLYALSVLNIYAQYKRGVALEGEEMWQRWALSAVCQRAKRRRQSSFPVGVLKILSKVLRMVASGASCSSRFTRKSLSTRIW